MPQLAPMPWITLFSLLYFFLALFIISIWTHRPPLFSSPLSSSQSSALQHPATWQWS